MNKKLLAMAVSAAMFAPVAAQADVTVYGIAQVEWVNADDDSQDSTQSVDDNAGRSRLGVKFSEKLGEGLTAFGKVEFRIDPADNNNSGTSGNATAVSGALGQRDAFVGLKGSWGSLAAGSFNAPYKTAGGVKWDPWAATHLQARRNGGMTGGAGIGGHNGFMRNAVFYTSPDMNGFQAQFAISPDDTQTPTSNTENSVDADNDYSLAVSYKNGPWNAIFAYNNNNNDVIDDEKLWKVGLQWKSGPWTLAGQYEDVSDADAVNAGGSASTGNAYRICGGCDGNVLWLNGQYKAGNNIFTVSYGNTDVDVPSTGATGGVTGDYEHDYWAVGVIHKFSKKTRVFVGYTETEGDDDAITSGKDDQDVWSVGIRKDF